MKKNLRGYILGVGTGLMLYGGIVSPTNAEVREAYGVSNEEYKKISNKGTRTLSYFALGGLLTLGGLAGGSIKNKNLLENNLQNDN